MADDKITGNNVVSSDFVRVLMALKDNILKDIHCLELAVVKEINDEKIICQLVSDPSISIQAIRINNMSLELNQKVLIGFNDNDFKSNLLQISNTNGSSKELDAKIRHVLTNGIVITNFTGGGGGDVSNKADVDAGNLTPSNITSWRTVLSIPSQITSVDGLTGGTISSAVTVNGNINGQYLTGTWLRSTNATDLPGWTDVWVNGNGWLYKRSKANFKNDVQFDKTEISTSGIVSQNISPNTYYEFTSGSLTSLTLNLQAPISGKMSTYFVRFYTGNSVPVLNVTAYSGTLMWNCLSPNLLNANTYYDLIIKDNIASLIPTHTSVGLYTSVTLFNNPDVSNVGGSVSVIDILTSEVVTNSLVVGKTYRVTATPDSNYSINRILVNGNNIVNNDTFVASYATTVIAEFIGNSGILTYNTPTGAIVTVKKNSSTGEDIPSGSTVYYYDNIYILVTSETGYTVSTSTSGLSRVSQYNYPNNYYVTSSTPTITITATPS